ncbi:DUF1192 domain-containing protein [Sphingomonas morindae]|uniref:DUF1192 domain-containing protein n=1 Tax=Sphingomonas morindae TaxID=1541170 RepID=A0ABY4X7L0_9SPHN|nr:DUF1192 domain-containing protein [Sphingomonas morindae]USI72929.1 DUF1192 domain-containing protein [Sphingomonas morindae]
MDGDDSLPRARHDPLALLASQDLGLLSVEELHARIAALQAEVARTTTQVEHAVNTRATADALFRR